jgi:multiple sugar transport system permease protein
MRSGRQFGKALVGPRALGRLDGDDVRTGRVWAWTDFLYPLIYLNDEESYTLSIGLYSFLGQHGVQWGPLMAACVMFTLPAFLIFLVFQRYFIGGIATGALK